MNKIAEALNFLVDRKSDLPKNRQDNAYKYNLAIIRSYEKNYDEAIHLLNDIEYTDIAYYTGSKYFLIKIYYELAFYEALLPVLDSLRVYMIRNSNIPDFRRKGTLNFIRLAKRLIDLKMNKETLRASKYLDKVKKLRSLIKQEKILTNKQWLLKESMEN